MGIIAINTYNTGQVGFQNDPTRATMVTSDDAATVTGAGYLDNQNKFGHTVSTNQVWEILYNYDSVTNTSTFGIFTVTYANGSYTLNAWTPPGGSTGTIVNGTVALFSGTTGQIASGGAPSNAASPFFATSPGALTIGNFLKAGDANGTVADGGAAFHSGTTTAFAGGGTTNTFTATGVTAASKVIPVIATSTNSVSIIKCLPGAGNFAITFSADPGAATTLNWISISAAI